MADIRSNINVNIDTSNALAAIKQLQGQISAFHSSLRNSGSAANQAISQDLTKNLLNSINATKQFSATLSTVNNEAQAFTSALEKNKFSLGQYFKYSASGTKSFGKLFKKEFDAIEKTAIERVKTTQTQIIKLGRTASGSFESIKVKPLTLDMQSLGTQVAITAQKQQIFNKLIQQGSTQLLNFGKNTQWAGRQLMVGLTIPLGILGSAAIQTFKDMEEQVIRFKRVYGELFTTQEETDRMVENLQRLAKEFTKYGVSVANTMELAADAAAMGKMGDDLMAQVESATKLAVLGGVAQEEALKTTISLTNAFGATAEELAGQIDFLNAVENQTVTSIEDLTIAIPKAGPVIKQLGGDVKDLAFFLTAMKEGGINASEGANAIKSGLARMINPTKQATEMLAGYGININAIVEGNAGNIKNTVLEFANALDELDPLARARAIEQMFGKFQFARISALFQNVVDEGNQAQRVLRLTNATTEELAILSERELKRVEDSPLYKFQKAIEDIKVALVPLGEQFLKLITPLVQFATKMLEQFNNLDSGVKDFIAGIVGVLGLVAPVALMTFGLFANGIANLIKGFNFVRLLFVRVAQAGTGLNSQLNYMTQEHLEASTVAQQLAAAHNGLTSSFLVEESALRRLIQAYTEAAVAMQRYNAVAPVARTPGMKLASGIVSVPGPKGAGDVVPAMLSPGEAVIPSAMAQKYAPLIQGMISDNIPGFNEGLDPANRILEFIDPRRRPAKESASIINSAGGDGVGLARQLGEAGVSAKNAMKIMSEAADNAKVSLERLDAYLDIVTKNIQSAPRNQAGGVKNSAGLVRDIREQSGFDPNNQGMPLAHIGGGTKVNASQASGMIASGALKTYKAADAATIAGLNPNEMVGIKSGLGIKMRDQSINARLAGSGTDIGEFNADIAATGVEKWYDSIKIGGGNIDELSEQTKILDAEFQRLANAVPEGTTMFDSAQQAAAHTASTGQGAASLETLYGQARSNVKGQAPELVGVLDTAAATPTEIRARGITAPGSKRKPLGEPIAELRDAAISEGIAEMDEGGRDMVRGMVQGAKDEGQMNSPSKRMYEEGKNLVRGMIQGVKDGIAESSGKTPPTSNLPKPPGPPPIPGFENKPTPPPIVNQNLEKGKNIGKKFVEKAEGAIAKGLSKTKTGRTLLDTMAQNQASQMNAANGGKGAIVVDADGKVLAEVKSLQDQRADLINKEGQLNDEDRANLNKEAQLLDEQATAGTATRRGQRSAEKAKEKQDRKDARKAAAQKRASRSTRALGALGTMTMVAGMAQGMEGKVGEIARGVMPALTGLTAIAPMLLALPAPLAILVGAVGLAAAAFFGMNAATKKLRENAKKLTDQFGSSSETLQKIAQVSGQVSGTEVMSRRRESASSIFPIVEGKQTFGSSFLQSEFGASMKSSVPNLIAALGQAGAESRILQQMSDAVLSGALTVPQARSIVEELAVQLENRALGVNLQAKISELFGPNGEALLEGGALEIRIKAVNETADTFIDSLSDAEFAASIFDNSFQRDLAGFALSIFENIPFISEMVRPAGERVEEYWNSVTFAASDAVSAVSGYQSSVDQLDLTYEKLIAKAKQEGKVELVSELEAKRLKERTLLLESQASALEQISSGFKDLAIGEDGKLSFYAEDILNGIDESILSRYEPGSKEYNNMKKALSKLSDFEFSKDVGEDAAIELQIKALVDAGELSETSLNNLLAMDSATGVTAKAVISLVGKIGAGKTKQAMDLMSLFVNKDGTPNIAQRANFMLAIDATANPNEYLDMFIDMSRYGYVINVQAIFDTVLNDPKKADAILSQFAEIDNLEKQDKKVKVSFIQETMTLGETTMAALQKDQEYFESLPPVQQILYLRGLVTMEVAGPGAIEQFRQWQASQLGKLGLRSGLGGINPTDLGLDFTSFMVNRMNMITNIDEAFNKLDPGNDPDTGGGTDLFSNILNRLQQVRDAAINAAGGIDELKRVVGKGKNLEIFSGMDQQLRFAGYGSEFISFINSLDKEAREKFVKINDGIVKVTASGYAMNKAFAEASLGDYQFGLVQGLADINKQIASVNKLMKNGSSLTDAYEMSKDAQLAYAIATAATDEEVQQLIRDFQRLKKAQEEWQKTSVEGLESLVNKQLGDIQEVFSAKEQKVQLEFEADSNYLTNATNGLITMAQRDIEYRNNLIDDLNYGLDQISYIEDEVNKKYDERLEALQKVKEVNEDIVDLERAQLDVAQALRSGDIAAAARAIQEQRAKAAERRQQEAEDLLERARKQELGAITSPDGKTRLQIEQEIKNITKEIAEIEEKRLEPNQQLLADLERARDVALEAIGTEGYLGKTKAEWALVENGVRLAKTESEGFKQSIIDTITNVEKLKALYGDSSTFITKTAPELTAEQQKAIDTIKSNRDAVRKSPGTTAADKKMIQENVKLIKMLRGMGIADSLFMSKGGMVPKYYAAGGFARGTDTVPSMLTPGEFVVRRHSVRNFGADKLNAINSGTYNGESVYNYSVNVNVRSDANPDQIARAVMTQIRGIESQRIRSNKY